MLIQPIRWLWFRWLRWRGLAWRVTRVSVLDGTFTLHDGTRHFFVDRSDAFNLRPGEWVTMRPIRRRR